MAKRFWLFAGTAYDRGEGGLASFCGAFDSIAEATSATPDYAQWRQVIDSEPETPARVVHDELLGASPILQRKGDWVPQDL